MRSTFKHKLWDADIELFESMRENYQSENERRFFEYLHEVELWDFCMSGELLLHENDNEDRFYIMRECFDEYEIGRDVPNVPLNLHVQGLAVALSQNMKENGFFDEDITFGEWLKRHDYKGVRYDQNNDYL